LYLYLLSLKDYTHSPKLGMQNQDFHIRNASQTRAEYFDL